LIGQFGKVSYHNLLTCTHYTFVLKFDKILVWTIFYYSKCILECGDFLSLSFHGSSKINVKCYQNFIKCKITNLVCTYYNIMENIFSNNE